mmetsp:Transcript_103500/g.221314  ORF Transcript_103500/g.221314 Transcript_103500/m.221314 type:complete len:196 (-) Transcript_103500:8-595(-)
MLDSHVVNVQVKPRMSPEEKLAKEVQRRRLADEERCSRIFNVRFRTMGLDTETLDQQVAEKQERKQREAEEEKASSFAMGKVNKQHRIMERERRRVQQEEERSCNEYNRNLRFEARREFDLNDPNASWKERPARIGDDDPRCGPASMQKFSGEDLMHEERVAQQRRYVRTVLEHQIFEKSQRSSVGYAEQRICMT